MDILVYLIDTFYKFSKYLTFVIGGGLGLLINLIITIILSEIFGVKETISYVFGLGANVLFNFAYHKYITFQVKDKTRERFSKFAIITLAITGINYILVYFSIEILGIFYIVSIITITLFISVLNYLVNKIWVFK